MTRLFRTMIALVCAIGLQPAMAFAQTAGSGTIEGVVTDASGAMLPVPPSLSRTWTPTWPVTW